MLSTTLIVLYELFMISLQSLEADFLKTFRMNTYHEITLDYQFNNQQYHIDYFYSFSYVYT